MAAATLAPGYRTAAGFDDAGDGVTALVAAALQVWVADARRHLSGRVGRGDVRRCEQALELIVRRPPGCPLVEAAAGLCGVSEAVVWAELRRRTYGPGWQVFGP